MASIDTYCAEILKVLGQPTRMKIIETLRDGGRCVTEIFSEIGEEQSNTSRHLSTMVKCSILQSHRDGLKSIYSIKHKDILRIIDLTKTVMEKETRVRQMAQLS